MLLRIWEGKGEKEGEGPQGSPWLEVGVFPRFSPNLGQGHYFSEYEPQFSSKFSKALVTHTPKGLRALFPCPRHEQADPLFEACWPLQITKRVQGPPQSLCALPSRPAGWAEGAVGPSSTEGGGGGDRGWQGALPGWEGPLPGPPSPTPRPGPGEGRNAPSLPRAQGLGHSPAGAAPGPRWRPLPAAPRPLPPT